MVILPEGEAETPDATAEGVGDAEDGDKVPMDAK
jgi:hypothetical protein